MCRWVSICTLEWDIPAFLPGLCSNRQENRDLAICTITVWQTSGIVLILISMKGCQSHSGWHSVGFSLVAALHQMPHCVLSVHESFKASEKVSIDKVHKFSWRISVHLKASLRSFGSFENTSSIQYQRVKQFPFCSAALYSENHIFPNVVVRKGSLRTLSFCQVN